MKEELQELSQQPMQEQNLLTKGLAAIGEFFYGPNGQSTMLFSHDHLAVLNKKLAPHYRISRDDPVGDTLDGPSFKVSKLKNEEPQQGFKRFIQLVKGDVAEVMLETSSTKQLHNFINSQFSSELGFNTTKPAEPVRHEAYSYTLPTKSINKPTKTKPFEPGM